MTLTKVVGYASVVKKIPLPGGLTPSMVPGALSSDKKTQNVKFLLIPPTDFGFYFIKSIHF